MKDYVAENDRILEEWRKKYIEENQSLYPKCPDVGAYFAYDGIMFKGEFYIDECDVGAIRRKVSGKENKLWTECPLRVLFLTKDENTNDNEAWDVRTETFYKKGEGKPPQNKTVSGSFFFQNEACLLYGLLNTKPTEDGLMMYNAFSWEDVLKFSDENIFARINCKKEVGYGTISNNKLEVAIKEYFANLKEQILNLDADILVCCGNQNENNIILNTVYNIYENEFEYVDCVEGQGTGMHYNAKQNKLAIDAYHLSYLKGGLEARYNETMGMYYEFLKKHPDFTKTHRT